MLVVYLDYKTTFTFHPVRCAGYVLYRFQHLQQGLVLSVFDAPPLQPF